MRSRLTFPCSCEEEAHDKHLQSSHSDHEQVLDDAKPEYPALCTPHRAEVPVFSCAEIFLVAGDGAELARNLEDGFGEHTRLSFWCALLGGEGGALFVLDLYV